MKLGFFWDFRNPPDWQRPWSEHTARLLELLAHSESLGADAAWFSEHHLFEDGYLPQPFVFAAAAAARTSRLRLGTAISLAPLRHPRHIAEEAVMVDLVSGGRFELGLGAGYVADEFAAFGVDRDARFRITDDTTREVVRLLRGGELVPPPAQASLPVWLGYQTPKGARRAGRIGVGLLSLDRAAFGAYTEGLAEGGHDVAGARVGGVINLIVADDPDKTKHELLPYYAYQSFTYAQAHGAPGTFEQTRDKFASSLERKGELPGMAVHDVAGAIALLNERTQGLPVEHVYLWSFVANMPEAMALRHLELCCSQVKPALGR